MACWIVTSTSTPSTRRLLDDTLVDSTQVWAPTLVQLDQKAVAVAAHAAHSVVSDGGRDLPDVRERRPRAAGVPGPVQAIGSARQGITVEMALPAEPKRRLKPHEYFGETERRYARG